MVVFGVVLASTAVFGAILVGVAVWRAATFDRTTAIILSMREEVRMKRGSPYRVIVGDLAFERRGAGGEIIPCRYEFDIGRPGDGLVVGDRLEIIPATGTCQRADIVGRVAAD